MSDRHGRHESPGHDSPCAGPMPGAREDAGAGVRAVTPRSCGLTLVLLPLNAYWVVQMERVRYSAHPTTISLFFNAVFLLLVLTLINRVVGSRRARWELSRAELLFIYTAVVIGSVMCSHDMLQVLVPMLMWPYYFATPSNNWKPLFVDRYLPDWVMMPDVGVMRGYFQGNDTLYRLEYLRAWIGPVAIWCAFIGSLVLVMLCLNVILRRQWTESEKLSYPIAQLPLQITDGRSFLPGGLFRNRVFWLGFAVASFIDGVNSLHVYYPNVPTIGAPGGTVAFYDLNVWVTQKPWNAIGWTPISFFPFLIGLGILMPLDFLFSAWFFYWSWKLQHVLTVQMAWDADPRFPYDNDQAFGAYMAFLLMSIWLSRRHLMRAIRHAIRPTGELDDSREPIRYRAALLGIALGAAALVSFATAIGIALWAAVLFFAIYFALAIAITRMRAEMGTPVHDLHFTGPDWILPETMGQQTFSGNTLTGFSLFYWFNRAYRSHAMPSQLEAWKMADVANSGRRQWFWGMLVVSVLAAFIGFWAMLHLMYQYGATAKAIGTFGSEAYTRLDSWLNYPKPASVPACIAVLVGFSTAVCLQTLRSALPWWPFHPLAYAVSSAWEMNLVWLPLAIAWLAKSVIIRYAGRHGFQRAVPFFIGLILGQFVLGSILNLLGIWLQIPTYQFWQ